MKKYIAMMTMFLIVFVAGMRQAEAIPTITVDDGVNPLITIADGGGSDTLAGTPGAVLYVGSVGVWTLTVDLGQTKPVIGSAVHGQIDLNVTATSNAAGSLTVWFSDTGFTPPVVPAGITLDTGGTTVGTVTVNGFADTTDVLFGVNTPIGTLGPFGPGAFSGTTNGGVVTAPFSMSLQTIVTHAGAGTTTLDSHQTVPEPATLLLLGSGLLGLGVLGRKRIKA